MKKIKKIILFVFIVAFCSCEDTTNNAKPYSAQPATGFITRDTNVLWSDNYYALSLVKNGPQFYWAIDGQSLDTVKVFFSRLDESIISLKNGYFYFFNWPFDENFYSNPEHSPLPEKLDIYYVHKDSLSSFFSDYNNKNQLIFLKDISLENVNKVSFNIEEFRWLSSLTGCTYTGVDSNYYEYPGLMGRHTQLETNEPDQIIQRPFLIDSNLMIYTNEITTTFDSSYKEKGYYVINSHPYGLKNCIKQYITDTVNFHINNNSIDDLTFIQYK